MRGAAQDGESPSTPKKARRELNLLDLNGDDLFRVCSFMDARSCVRLAACNKELREILEERVLARWVARNRNWTAVVESIRGRPRAGQLGEASSDTASIVKSADETGWTMEKLDAVEAPPRLRDMRFPFGNARLIDCDGSYDLQPLAAVFEYMRTHPNCLITVVGHTQPDCPRAIALSISAERVRVVCQYVARLLVFDRLGLDADAERDLFANLKCFMRKDCVLLPGGRILTRPQIQETMAQRGADANGNGGGNANANANANANGGAAMMDDHLFMQQGDDEMLIFRYFGVPVDEDEDEDEEDEDGEDSEDDEEYEGDFSDEEEEEEDHRGDVRARADGPRTRGQEVRGKQLASMQEAIRAAEARFVMMALGNTAPCHEIVYERLPGGELIQVVNDEELSANRRTEFFVTYGNGYGTKAGQ